MKHCGNFRAVKHTYPVPLDMLCVAGCVGFSLPPYLRGFFPRPLTETCFLFCSPLSLYANVLVAACLNTDATFSSSHHLWHGLENWQRTMKATQTQVIGVSPVVAPSFRRCHDDFTSRHVTFGCLGFDNVSTTVPSGTSDFRNWQIRTQNTRHTD